MYLPMYVLRTYYNVQQTLKRDFLIFKGKLWDKLGSILYCHCILNSHPLCLYQSVSLTHSLVMETKSEWNEYRYDALCTLLNVECMYVVYSSHMTLLILLFLVSSYDLYNIQERERERKRNTYTMTK